ncbi:uncharacterized protein TNCV_4935731 [Trichonephila clavipes]|nr:uncharacterized protein TNCV_4935731 [Trichonephila clavipes]
MTINLGKTTGQYFTLNRQPFTANLAYRGPLLQHNDVSTYPGYIFGNQLKRTKHVEHGISKARKRLPILKRLAGAEWECGRVTLKTTYKTYVQPVLNYCNEVLVSASNKVLGMLDVFQNQALRLITGGDKTTPVLAMRLLCDLQPMTNLVWRNAY